MKRITQSAALVVTLVLALGTLAMSAPKSERARKTVTIDGRVLQIDQKARTMLVDDYWSKKLYLVNVPEGATFKITFGLNMRLGTPELWQAHKNDRVHIRCIRNQEHLAQLEDGRKVVLMTVAH